MLLENTVAQKWIQPANPKDCALQHPVPMAEEQMKLVYNKQVDFRKPCPVAPRIFVQASSHSGVKIRSLAFSKNGTGYAWRCPSILAKDCEACEP